MSELIKVSQYDADGKETVHELVPPIRSFATGPRSDYSVIQDSTGKVVSVLEGGRIEIGEENRKATLPLGVAAFCFQLPLDVAVFRFQTDGISFSARGYPPFRSLEVNGYSLASPCFGLRDALGYVTVIPAGGRIEIGSARIDGYWECAP